MTDARDDADAEPSIPELDIPALVEKVERALVGGDARYTREDMARLSDLGPDEVRGLWRALGFAAVADDERVFTAADLEALDRVKRLRQIAGLDDDTLRAMTRILGQTFARLAAWQGQMVLQILAASPELLTSEEHIVELLDSIVPLTLDLHDYVWRRQSAAYFSRIASNAAGGAWPDAEQTRSVGFADMTEFTTLTRRSNDAELQAVLERFESTANEVAGEHRGQIVKTIGDEVLFVADTSGDAAEIALDLVFRAESDDILPSLRVGVASGPVVSRLGDVYGATVNIASRLTGLARPGSVLVDRTMADDLADEPGYALRALRPENVRGYQHLRPWRLRRAGD